MACLLLITSTGLSLDMHFCGNNLRSFNLFGKAKNCYELAALQAHCKNHPVTTQPNKPACKMTKKDCCHNKTVSLKVDLTGDTNTTDFLLSSTLQDFVIAFVAVFIQEATIVQQYLGFSQYKPPLLLRDLPVLLQSFLI